MRIAYAAHTETCTLYLDEDGICRRVVRLRRSTLVGVAPPASEDAAERCIGAQYVASLDFETRGGLVPSPVVGKPMIFAYVRDNGRVGLVRTGALVRFDTRPADLPDSGVREMPTESGVPEAIASAADTVRVPEFDDDLSDGGATEVRTQVFRSSSRPPPAQSGLRPPPMNDHASGRWTPPTPVERVRIPPPATSSTPTLRGTEPRTRGMLPPRPRREGVG